MSSATSTEALQVPDKVANSGAESDEGAIIDSQTAGSSLDDKRRRKLADIPAKYRAMYRAAWKHKSRKKAIRAFCLECLGYMPSEVRLCTSPDCPLYEFRVEG
jgi:hypothetical protein